MTYSAQPSRTSGQAAICGLQDEQFRLEMLASYRAGQLEGDPELGGIVRFVAKLCSAPTAAVSLVEGARQRFVARRGLDLEASPRATSICAHTMMGPSILEVLDASRDPRFRDFSLVTGEAHIRYYAGAPLVSPEGAPLGALCVIDSEPRDKGMGGLELEGLQVLAQAVMRRLEAHRSDMRVVGAIECH